MTEDGEEDPSLQGGEPAWSFEVEGNDEEGKPPGVGVQLYGNACKCYRLRVVCFQSYQYGRAWARR